MLNSLVSRPDLTSTLEALLKGHVESSILLVPGLTCFYFSSSWLAALRSALMISGSVNLRTSSIATGHSEGPLIPPFYTTNFPPAGVFRLRD